MDAIRQWAFGICAAAVACGLMQLIMPRSGMQKIFSAVVSVFFLGCLLSPLFFSVALPDANLQGQEQLQQEIRRRSSNLESMLEKQFTSAASESLRQAAIQTLEDMGVEYQEIYVHIHDEEGGGISVRECEITLSNSYRDRHDEIRQALIGRLGVNVLIGYEEDD